jgi:hypothetical protein
MRTIYNEGFLDRKKKEVRKTGRCLTCEELRRKARQAKVTNGRDILQQR